MIISFSGAQSTGKTTLLNECQKKYGNTFAYIPEVTRLVKNKYNVNINEEGNNITQLCIINQHLENYLTYKNNDVIMDRCILDGLVYTKWLLDNKKVDGWVYSYCNNVFHYLIKKIDVIFYTESNIPLESDGERSESPMFKRDIVTLFEQWLLDLNSPIIRTTYHIHANIIKLGGSVEERMETINKTLK